MLPNMGKISGSAFGRSVLKKKPRAPSWETIERRIAKKYAVGPSWLRGEKTTEEIQVPNGTKPANAKQRRVRKGRTVGVLE